MKDSTQFKNKNKFKWKEKIHSSYRKNIKNQ